MWAWEEMFMGMRKGVSGGGCVGLPHRALLRGDIGTVPH